MHLTSEVSQNPDSGPQFTTPRYSVDYAILGFPRDFSFNQAGSGKRYQSMMLSALHYLLSPVAWVKDV